MQISLEDANSHSVQAYGKNQIQINSIIYEASLIVSREEIISELAIKSVTEMDEAYLELLTSLKPELIIIGHDQIGQFPPMSMIAQLSKLRIGIESMSLGAACRTYNVLLGEDRAVVAGFIF